MTTHRRRFVSLLSLAALALGAYGGGVSAAAPPDVARLLHNGSPLDDLPNWPPRFDVPRFAYVANFNDDTVSIYAVNDNTGQLRHHGYVATGTDPSNTGTQGRSCCPSS